MEGDVVVMGPSLRCPATIKRNRVAIHRGRAMPGGATSSRPSLRRIAYARSNASFHKGGRGMDPRNHAPVSADGKAVSAWREQPASAAEVSAARVPLAI